jgi:hypothetical protein
LRVAILNPAKHQKGVAQAIVAKLYLFFLSGSKKGKIDFSDAQVVRIGRQPHCEIKLDPHQDIPASGDHAQIINQGGNSFMLYDSSSSWGTYKNGKRLTGPVPLGTGDVITLGIDADGNEGPRLKFYLEKDILSCPSCSGPVYKRHFRCPDCRKKVCLRCIDFDRQTCLPCVHAPANTVNAGYELVMESGVHAKAPARVVISGKDAQRAKRAQARRRAEKKAKKKRTKRMVPSRDPASVAEHVDPGISAEAFCTVCCEFVQGRTFTCSACKQPCCVMHRCGTVCPPCTGTVAVKQMDASSFRAGRGTEPELKVPDLDDLLSANDLEESQNLRAPKRPRPQAQQGLAPGTNPTQTRRPPRQAPQIQASQIQASQIQASQIQAPQIQASQIQAPQIQAPPPTHSGGSYLPPRSKIRARAPTTIPCERSGCMAALDPRTFFICDSCHKRLCPTHRVANRLCEKCPGQRQSVQPPQFAPPPARPAPIPGTMQFDPKRILGTPPPPPSAHPFAPNPAPGADPFAGYGRPAPSTVQGPPLPEYPPGGLSDSAHARRDPFASGFAPRGHSSVQLPPSHYDPPPRHDPPSASSASRADEEHDQDMFDTVDDEESPAWGPQDLIQTDDAIRYGRGLGLGDVSFECPYCEAALPAHAPHCPKCNKAL